MITKTVQFSDLWDWLQSSDSYKNNFSYNGARALFDYLEELSNDTDEPVDFDPVAWCVEYTEYDSAMDACAEYGDSVETPETEAEAIEILTEHTTFIPTEGTSVIIADF